MSWEKYSIIFWIKGLFERRKLMSKEVVLGWRRAARDGDELEGGIMLHMHENDFFNSLLFILIIKLILSELK